MAHYLLVYDRVAAQLVRQQRFEDALDAMRARFVVEAEFRGRTEIEVVAVAAASEDDLRETHGRYFLDVDDLAARLS